MKVLHIITGLDNGGAESTLYRLITNDASNCHQVVSLVDYGWYGQKLIDEGIYVHVLNMPRGRISLKGLIKLYKIVGNIKPDIVQTWLYHADFIGGVIAWVKGVRNIVWNIRNSGLDTGKTSINTRFVARINSWISYLIPKKIISCSVEGINFHSRLGYQKKKMVLIPNGYDTTQLRPDNNIRIEVRNKFEFTQTQILFGMVARWDPQKNHANLIKAMSYLKLQNVDNWHCLLIGNNMTPSNRELVNLLETNNVKDKVSLLGPTKNIVGVMNAIDIHILSSVSEAFPNVLAEAMACGTPCVTTSVGDALTIVGNTGWVVPPSEPQALQWAIQQAIDEMHDPAKWENRKKISREKIVTTYSLKAMVENYNSLWYSISN